MKIVFFTNNYHTNQNNIVSSLLANKFRVQYLVVNIVNKKVPFNLKLNALDKHTNYFGQIYHYLKDEKPDVIIIRGRRLVAMKVYLISKFLNIPSLRSEQVILETEETFINKHIPSILLTLIKKVQFLFLSKTLITPIVKDYLKYQRYESKNKFFLPLPIDVKSQKSKKYNLSKQLKLLTVGKFQDRKKHFLLLHVVNILSQKYTIKLKIIGSCSGEAAKKYDKEMLNFIKKNSLENIVTIEKNKEHSQVLKEYKNHDLFILPSVDEEFGYSTVEAMAVGLPVIVSNDAGCQYLTNNNSNGFIFKKNDIADLKDKITYFLENKDQLKIKGASGRQFIQRYYSTEFYIKQLKRILKNEFNIAIDK